MPLGILSNGTNAMLQSGIAKNEMGDHIKHVFSVDDIQVFKPDPAVYRMVINGLGLAADEVLFASSNQWDVAGAASFGFEVCWVNREGQFRESVTYGENIKEVSSLTDLIDLVTTQT